MFPSRGKVCSMTFDKNYSVSANDEKEFIVAYLESSLWTATDDYGICLDEKYQSAHFSEEAVADAVRECLDFIDCNIELLHGLDPGQCGHDFSLTRNGHGAGFWDRGYGKVGDELTAVTKPYGETNVYVGDDNLLYFE